MPVPRIPFLRVQSCGNDFLLVDNRDKHLAGRETELALGACRRGVSEGADGVLLAERALGSAAIRMRLINADGSEGEMCGNGALAFSRVAAERFGLGGEFVIETLGGEVSAVVARGVVRLTLHALSERVDRFAIAVAGEEVHVRYLEVYKVPHAVVATSPAEAAGEISARLGAQLCHHPSFARGANVNFAAVLATNRLEVRTFERGVDAETLSCGTGSIASVLALRDEADLEDLVDVGTPGGTLRIRASRSDGPWRVELEGRPRTVAEGMLLEDAWAS